MPLSHLPFQVQAGWLGTLAPDHAAIISEAHAQEGARSANGSGGGGSGGGSSGGGGSGTSCGGKAGSHDENGGGGGTDDAAFEASLDPALFSALNFGFFGDAGGGGGGGGTTAVPFGALEEEEEDGLLPLDGSRSSSGSRCPSVPGSGKESDVLSDAVLAGGANPPGVYSALGDVLLNGNGGSAGAPKLWVSEPTSTLGGGGGGGTSTAHGSGSSFARSSASSLAATASSRSVGWTYWVVLGGTIELFETTSFVS